MTECRLAAVGLRRVAAHSIGLHKSSGERTVAVYFT
jgi:hypothetical protein